MSLSPHLFSGDVFPATFGIGGRVQVVLSQEDLTRRGE